MAREANRTKRNDKSRKRPRTLHHHRMAAKALCKFSQKPFEQSASCATYQHPIASADSSDDIRFKASKEWNDSMKSIASSANSFTQNENFKKAKASYDATSRVASSSTASAFKSTGKALGQSAAWTWESAPIRGLREGASIAARGIGMSLCSFHPGSHAMVSNAYADMLGQPTDKATKPIRETEAFKSVQDTIGEFWIPYTLYSR